MRVSLSFGKKTSDDVNIPTQEITTQIIAQFPEGSIPKALADFETQRHYEELSKALGFIPAELVRAQLIEFFEQEGMQLYDYEQVSAWLSAKKAEAGADHWCWRPLREKDILDIKWNYESWRDVSDGYYSRDSDSCRTYSRLIPSHALEKVVSIEKQFPGLVSFFVSDFASANPDPFIAVRPKKRIDGNINDYLLVFDVWDEPGFGK